jgi:hypothetical protein
VGSSSGRPVHDKIPIVGEFFQVQQLLPRNIEFEEFGIDITELYSPFLNYPLACHTRACNSIKNRIFGLKKGIKQACPG